MAAIVSEHHAADLANAANTKQCDLSVNVPKLDSADLKIPLYEQFFDETLVTKNTLFLISWIALPTIFSDPPFAYSSAVSIKVRPFSIPKRKAVSFKKQL